MPVKKFSAFWHLMPINIIALAPPPERRFAIKTDELEGTSVKEKLETQTRHLKNTYTEVVLPCIDIPIDDMEYVR